MGTLCPLGTSTLSAGTLYPLGTPQPLPQRPHRLRVPYHPFPATPPVAAPLSRVADSRRYPLYPLSPHLPPPSADRHPTPPTPPSYPLPPPRQSLDSQGNINRKIMVAPIFEARFGILVEFGVLEVSTFPSAKYHPYAYMSAD